MSTSVADGHPSAVFVHKGFVDASDVIFKIITENDLNLIVHRLRAFILTMFLQAFAALCASSLAQSGSDAPIRGYPLRGGYEQERQQIAE
ncbi:hypothetical protein [Luteibacter sp. OK325]|uniref:hypothetical protein n=1 Tax=Luteibacter sp. OK325 TaxID=2135670 RepID=UPI0011B290F3|nr:hypothetical protein [Luteibacter sp. OK325]